MNTTATGTDTIRVHLGQLHAGQVAKTNDFGREWFKIEAIGPMILDYRREAEIVMVTSGAKLSVTLYTVPEAFVVQRTTTTPPWISTTTTVQCERHEGHHRLTHECLYPHLIAPAGSTPSLGHPLTPNA